MTNDTTRAAIRHIHLLPLGNLMTQRSATRLRRWCATNGILRGKDVSAEECKEAIRAFFPGSLLTTMWVRRNLATIVVVMLAAGRPG